MPGVFWCNRKINTETPSLGDIAPTALDLFSVPIPNYMQGSPLFGDAARKEAPARGGASAGQKTVAQKENG